MKIEHGLYYISVPSDPPRVVDGERVFDLVGLPALLQRRRKIAIEKDGEPKIVTTKNRRGVDVKKMTRTLVTEEHEVADVVCLLHALTPEQKRAAEIAGITGDGATVHTGVYETDKPEARRFMSAGMVAPVSAPQTIAPPKPKPETEKPAETPDPPKV